MDLSGEKIEVKIPVKEKKPRSEKQKEATARALIILKQRRDEKVKAEQEIKDSKVLAKPINLQRPSTPQAPVVMASRPTTAERLTGKALLDSIFFK